MFAIHEVTLTGALIPRDPRAAERMAVRSQRRSGRYVELMTGLTREVPGGWRVTVAIVEQARRG